MHVVWTLGVQGSSLAKICSFLHSDGTISTEHISALRYPVPILSHHVLSPRLPYDSCQ